MTIVTMIIFRYDSFGGGACFAFGIVLSTSCELPHLIFHNSPMR